MAESNTELAFVIAGLLDAYPSANLDEGNVVAYMRLLDDVPIEELRPVVERWALEVRYPPSPAELRKLVVEARLALPSAHDAWAEVEAACRLASGEAFDALLPISRAALRDVGGSWAVRTEGGPFVHRDFIAAYERRVEEAVRTANFEMRALGPAREQRALEGGKG